MITLNFMRSDSDHGGGFYGSDSEHDGIFRVLF
jgi:hypothetical protein